jgi:beta-N-acetylhexosaminidase
MTESVAARGVGTGRGRTGVSPASRLLWIGLPGTEVDDETARLLEAGVGGVVLFAHNITGVAQVRELASALRARAAGPLRVAIDHEGGHIVRIGAPLTRFPGPMAIGATGSSDLAEAVGSAMGRELAAIGVDVDLAPVLDVAADPRNPSVGARAFGDSVELVSRLGTAFIGGLRSSGVAATAKHFPGHGRTPIDSHVALPALAGGIEALRRADLPPFRAAIEAGVDLVMASHLVVDGLTDGLPASLSRRAMTDLLRGELGFEGLVVTDALRMRAVAADRSLPEACLEAIAAGADVVMPLDDQVAAQEAISAAGDGAILSTRVEEALGRIAGLDARLGEAAATRDGELELPDRSHAALAAELARASLTLCSAGTNLPIVESASVAVIDFPSRRGTPAEEAMPDGQGQTTTLGRTLGRLVPRTHEVLLDPDDGGVTSQAALEAGQAAELIVCTTRDAYLWETDRDLVRDVAALGRPTILVALRNPYDVAVLPRTDERVAAYADVPATLHALAEALTGRAGWPGRLPIHLGTMSGEGGS